MFIHFKYLSILLPAYLGLEFQRLQYKLYPIWNNDNRNKALSIKEYLDEIKPYLKDEKSQKIGKFITIKINFISSKDPDERLLIHSKSDNIEIMVWNKADEIIMELFQSLIYKY